MANFSKIFQGDIWEAEQELHDTIPANPLIVGSKEQNFSNGCSFRCCKKQQLLIPNVRTGSVHQTQVFRKRSFACVQMHRSKENNGTWFARLGAILLPASFLLLGLDGHCNAAAVRIASRSSPSLSRHDNEPVSERLAPPIPGAMGQHALTDVPIHLSLSGNTLPLEFKQVKQTRVKHNSRVWVARPAEQGGFMYHVCHIGSATDAYTTLLNT
jgi:hypothetical protein